MLVFSSFLAVRKPVSPLFQLVAPMLSFDLEQLLGCLDTGSSVSRLIYSTVPVERSITRR